MRWCFAAGLCAYVFMWWYGKPHLIVLGACSLAWLLVARWKSLSITMVGTGIFLLISGISFFNPLETICLQGQINSTFFFPNILETITNRTSCTVPDPCQCDRFCGDRLGLSLGLVLLAFPPHFLSPTASDLFGLLNFIIGNRAIFIQRPFYGLVQHSLTLLVALCEPFGWCATLQRRFIGSELAPLLLWQQAVWIICQNHLSGHT